VVWFTFEKNGISEILSFNVNYAMLSRSILWTAHTERTRWIFPWLSAPMHCRHTHLPGLYCRLSAYKTRFPCQFKHVSIHRKQVYHPTCHGFDVSPPLDLLYHCLWWSLSTSTLPYGYDTCTLPVFVCFRWRNVKKWATCDMSPPFDLPYPECVRIHQHAPFRY